MASNGSRPLIGLTSYLERTSFGVWDLPAAVLPTDYLDLVVAAGGVPVLLPPVGEWTVAELSRLDGLVLTGGPDVDPARYGQPAHERTDAPRAGRDEAELALFGAALKSGLPVLGVCRGMQLMNVALGGTLRQHILDEPGGPVHRPALGTFGRVDITVAARSRLAGIVGGAAGVHCHHHQAVDRLGAGLTAAAWSADGTVEAVELAGSEFVVGVQWHPEQDRTDARLVKALVQAAEGGA